MWSSFTVRILQDTDGWIVAAQFANAIAIGFAAVVASQYPKAKDRLLRIQSMRNHLASFKLFRSSVEAYFYIVIGGSDLPPYYNSTIVIQQAREDFFRFENKKEEIVSVLPGKAIEPFNKFLSFYKTLERLSHEKYDSTNDMYDAWQGSKKELDKVIDILEKRISGFRNKDSQ